MINLIKWLIHGHIHKWEIIVNIDLVNESNQRTGQGYDLQCRTCGTIKRITTKSYI